MKKVSGKANANLYKKGEFFWVRFSKAGRTLQKSLDTINVTDARLKRDLEISAFLSSPEKVGWKGKELVEDYFDQWTKVQTWRDSTRNHVLFQWNKHLKAFFGSKLLDEVTSTAWERYIDESRLKTPGRKLFNDRKYFSMFLHWCKKTGRINEVPFLASVDAPAKEGKVYSPEEIKKLINASPRTLRLQIMMAVTMGMRKREILTLAWDQIDFKERTIYLPPEKTKINKARKFSISDEVFQTLKARKENQDPQSPFVFPSPGNPQKSVGPDGNSTVWESVKNSTGIKGTFHSLRHTFLTNAFKSGVNPMVVCAYAGLSIEVAQKIYLHLNSDDTKQVANLMKISG